MTALAHRPLVAALVVVLLPLGGCDAFQPGAAVQVPTLTLPAPRPPKRQPTVAEALAVFPTLADVKRDPFLTAAEQEAEEKGTQVKEEIVVPPPVADKLKKARKHPASPVDQWARMELRLSSLFLSPDGKQHAVAHDEKTGRDLQIDQGQEFGAWVVSHISEDAIQLREKGGAHTQSFHFRTAATDPWKMVH